VKDFLIVFTVSLCLWIALLLLFREAPIQGPMVPWNVSDADYNAYEARQLELIRKWSRK
jgi:hypothetical protein